MAKNKAPKFDPQWVMAKKACRLNMEDIRMAKALGMSPQGLMKNNPRPTQRWKLPVKCWIRELYEKRIGLRTGPVQGQGSGSSPPRAQVGAVTEPATLTEDVPF